MTRATITTDTVADGTAPPTCAGRLSRSMRNTVVACALLSLGTALSIDIPTASAQTPAQAMIIVDGSNSMWTQIDGQAKSTIAVDAISTVLRQRSEALNAGVIVYGSRETNSCTDVVTAVELAPYDAEAITEGLAGISPEGATPIALALETAAEALPAGPATIALIADGRDNCSGDPCAMAAGLEQARPELSIHVIGFAGESGAAESLAPLACIGEATGGSFAMASDGPALLAALDSALDSALGTSPTPAGDANPPLDIAQAATTPTSFFRRSENGIPLPPIRPGSGQAPPAADAAPPVSDIADVPLEERPRRPVRMWAQLTEDTGAIPSDLVWRVFVVDPRNPSDYDLFDTSDAAQPQFSLPQGRYVVHVGYGRAYATHVLEVAESALDEGIVLDAGGLRVSQIGADDRPLPRGQSRLAVYSSEQDQHGQRRLLLNDMPPDSIVRLNAGTYHVVSQYGDANSVVRSDVRVQPGLLTDAAIEHHAATITLKLVTELGGEALANTAWSILSPGGDVVKESFGAFPTHVLAAGDYSVIARHEGELFNRDFTVSAGETREVELLAE